MGEPRVSKRHRCLVKFLPVPTTMYACHGSLAPPAFGPPRSFRHRSCAYGQVNELPHVPPTLAALDRRWRLRCHPCSCPCTRCVWVVIAKGSRLLIKVISHYRFNRSIETCRHPHKVTKRCQGDWGLRKQANRLVRYPLCWQHRRTHRAHSRHW